MMSDEYKEITCEKCSRRRKCEVGTEEAARKVVAQNKILLQEISTADIPRFTDEEDVEFIFREHLNAFFDVMSVLYTIPENGYFPENDASEEREDVYWQYRRYRRWAYKRSIQQAQMRILTLGRASCGFVGAYSSGKSSYLNKEVFGGKFLPEGAQATTSIPTYIFPGRSDKVILENMRGNIKILPGLDVLRELEHSSKPKECPCSFQWDAVIKRLFCFSSGLKYNSDLVYVDLPGYSASDSDNRSMKEAMEGCDKIVYFMPISNGELNEKDIEYLTTIDQKDLIMVLSKADKRSPDDCITILKKIKDTLKEKEIEAEDVLLYTTHPEVFASNDGFSKELENCKEKLIKFIMDTSAKEKDMTLSNDTMLYYLNNFVEFEKEMCSRLDQLDKIFSGFLGGKKLDDTFFQTWKNINKDIANSSGRYVDEHFFSTDVRILDYLNANINRAYNYYASDTYDSNFNISYEEALYGYTLYYIYKTALYTYVTKKGDNNYEEACKKIDALKDNYNKCRELIKCVYDNTDTFFTYHKAQTVSIIEDAKAAFQLVEDAYEELLNYVKNYEKRWYES